MAGEPINAKYAGPMKLAMTGDVELAASYRPRAMEMLADLINHGRPDQKVIMRNEDRLFESQGYRFANEHYTEGDMRIDIKCIVNETQRLAFIHAHNPKISEKKSKVEEPEERMPYLWIGVRPITGGWSGCFQAPDWMETSYSEGSDNWPLGFEGTAGYFGGIYYGAGETSAPVPWLFEPPGKDGGDGAAITPINDDGVNINGRHNGELPINETWSLYRREGGPTNPWDAILDQQGRVHFEPLPENISHPDIIWYNEANPSNLYVVTKDGTFASWGLVNRNIDPLAGDWPNDIGNQWWCAFWVDPHPELPPSASFVNYQNIDILQRRSKSGRYLLKLSARNSWGSLPGIIPQVVEVEVRNFKAPYTTRERFRFEMAMGANQACCFYPNGFYEYDENVGQTGPNPHLGDWLTEAILVSPDQPPKLIHGNIPVWGFEPGANQGQIEEQATRATISNTIAVFKGTTSLPYRTNIGHLLFELSSHDACGSAYPYPDADSLLGAMPQSGSAIFSAEDNGFLHSDGINDFMDAWFTIDGITEEDFNNGTYPAIFGYANNLGVTQIFVVPSTYDPSHLDGYTIIAKSFETGRWHVV